MRSKHSKSRFLNFVFLGVLFLLSPVIGYAKQGQAGYPSGRSRISFSLGGGYAHSEICNGLVGAIAEFQFSLSSNVRVGFGIGYLNEMGNMHMFGNSGGMSGGMMGSQMSGFSGYTHDFRAIPLTLNLYYVLPVSSRLDIFMVGGGGYYMSSFRDISTQEKSAFGSHAGFGFDLEVAERVIILIESLYRFVSLGEFVNELHPGFREGMAGVGSEEGFWHYNHSLGEYHFHVSSEDQTQMMGDSPPFSISLNGFSFRAGIKFRF
jgi:hypothetical protein